MLLAVLSLAGLVSAAASAAAESAEVRIAQPYGLLYLPTYVVVDRQLIEKHAAAAGLGPIKVTLQRLASGPASSDLILSGGADIAAGGSSPLMLLWDKTRGAGKIRGIMAMCQSPMFYITVDPHIRRIEDFGEGDRIAVSAVKVTLQAIYLQMAAAKAFGWGNRFKLDPLTVSMSNPDGMTALLSGASEVKTHATIMPFNAVEMASGKARLLFTSDDIVGDHGAASVIFTTEAWKTQNPKLYAAVAAAYEEAIELVQRDKRLAATIYLARESPRQSVAEIEKLLEDESEILFTSTPRGIEPVADFMYRIGTLHQRLGSWKELFWEHVHDRSGS
ncbi:MAG: ABC transporter substrate-binding protein [Alphaproteobacteria bacterium]|nr:ABC transporter substrate-binding protein [Alphaproteobacteria bacterium]